MSIKKSYGKVELIREIANRAGFTIGDVKIIIDTLIDLFEEVALLKGSMRIDNMISMFVKELPTREGYNPKTKQREKFPPTSRIYVRVSENIRDKLRDSSKKE